MSINIKDPDTDRLARELADATGETITHAVSVAVRDRLERVRAQLRRRRLADELDEIATRCAALPARDTRPEDEILGYDERGIPA